MRKVLIAASAVIALAAGSIVAAAPASAGPLERFCYYHPYAPICFEMSHHHHHHHHHWWW